MGCLAAGVVIFGSDYVAVKLWGLRIDRGDKTINTSAVGLSAMAVAAGGSTKKGGIASTPKNATLCPYPLVTNAGRIRQCARSRLIR